MASICDSPAFALLGFLKGLGFIWCLGFGEGLGRVQGGFREGFGSVEGGGLFRVVVLLLEIPNPNPNLKP